MDTAARSPRQFQGSEENVDFDIPQVLYGENFMPVAAGVKSVSYVQIIAPTANDDFDQIFPLRDSQENTVLFSPSDGQNYVHDSGTGLWTANPLATAWAAEAPPLYLSTASRRTPTTANVSRAYADGKTFVAYETISLSTAIGGASEDADGSVYFWDESTQLLVRQKPQGTTDIVRNLSIPIGDIGGVSSSNGYLLFWSGLSVHWAPFNGTSFDYSIYANGEVTGAGNQIPEDIEGAITAIVPVSGGFIIFTTKNAIAAFYNANNFASPWTFKRISNAGGVSNFEQVTVEGGLGALYAYTTGGMQKMSLNEVSTSFPDVTDFLGGRLIERFNTGSLTFTDGETTTEFFVKVTYCGQRFLVISYGTFPGIFSYALVWDAELERWGKLRIIHRDAFSYSYGTQAAELTYSMVDDVPYSFFDTTAYEDMVIDGGVLTYPRQSLAFLLDTGEVRLAVMDYRDPTDESEAFVLIGRNQLTRAKLATVHEVEVEGLDAGGQVSVLRSITGRTFEPFDAGYLREQSEDYAEYGFDMVTGKNFTFYIKGDFALTSLIVHASNDGNI